MAQNEELAAIIDNMPKYEDCRKEYFEHFHMFQKLSAVNYAALGVRTGLAAPLIGYIRDPGYYILVKSLKRDESQEK